MHQQQQNIIHVISYDNAQSTKIERPAPLSLHLKLHWNCNQQHLQGKGSENKGRQKKKNHTEAFSMALRGTQFQPFSGSLDKCSTVVAEARLCWILDSLPKSPFPGTAHEAASQEQSRINPRGPHSSHCSTALLPCPDSTSLMSREATRKAKTESYMGLSVDQEGLVWEALGHI